MKLAAAGESYAPIDFPFKFIKARNGKVMDIYLYNCGDQPSLDTLILFCQSKTEEIKDNRWYEFVFFDSSQNAVFPNLPESALYMELKTLKHIKAQYHICKALTATGQLTFATPNLSEGNWRKIEIK